MLVMAILGGMLPFLLPLTLCRLSAVMLLMLPDAVGGVEALGGETRGREKDCDELESGRSWMGVGAVFFLAGGTSWGDTLGVVLLE